MALEDRCCHRGVQLSLGSITAAGSLACRYHGWEYDGGDRCVHVPSLCTRTPVPEGFRVRSYPCIEQEHYVWVWMREGPPTVAAPAAIPGAGEHAWRQGTVEVACSADLMRDNILDSSHIPFVHVGTHWAYFLNRMSGFKEYEYEVRLTEQGLVVFYPPLNPPQKPRGPRTCNSLCPIGSPYSSAGSRIRSSSSSTSCASASFTLAWNGPCASAKAGMVRSGWATKTSLGSRTASSWKAHSGTTATSVRISSAACQPISRCCCRARLSASRAPAAGRVTAARSRSGNWSWCGSSGGFASLQHRPVACEATPVRSSAAKALTGRLCPTSPLHRTWPAAWCC